MESTSEQDKEVERTDSGDGSDDCGLNSSDRTNEIMDDKSSGKGKVNYINTEKIKKEAEENGSDCLPQAKLITPSEISDLSSNQSYEIDSSSNLSESAYRPGPIPSVFNSMTEEQRKLELLKIIEYINRGDEFLWKIKDIANSQLQ